MKPPEIDTTECQALRRCSTCRRAKSVRYKATVQALPWEIPSRLVPTGRRQHGPAELQQNCTWQFLETSKGVHLVQVMASVPRLGGRDQ